MKHVPTDPPADASPRADEGRPRVAPGEDARAWVLYESLPVGVLVVEDAGPSARCLYANPAFVRATGYDLSDVPSVEALLAALFEDEDERRQAAEDWPEVFAPPHHDVRHRVRTGDGRHRWLVLRSCAMPDCRRVLVARDATSEWEAHQALRASEERYRKLVEQLPVGIVVHDGERILFANPEAGRIVGIQAVERAIGRPIADFIHPDSRETVAQRVRQAIVERLDLPPLHERFVRVDGSPVEVEVIAGAVELDGRRVSQVIIRDITEEVRLRQEHERMEARLRETQKLESLALLAGGVAHDFNNLLMGILGNLEILRLMEGMPPEARERLDAIDRITQRAAELATQMLAYAGRSRLEHREIDLNATIEDLAQLMTSHLADEAALCFELDPAVPRIVADPTQVAQVLMNLVSNAADAIRGGSGRIRVSTGTAELSAADLERMTMAQGAEPGRYAWVEVEDDGPGMDAATLRRIFEPFFSTKAHGRGFGLAAVSGIVRAHRGVLEVRTAPGEGAAFRVYLPVRPPTRPSRAAPPAVREDGWRGEGAVLLVEDQAPVREVAAALLRRAGFEVIEAQNAAEALELARARDDLRCAVIDRSLPDLPGPDLLRRLHEEGRRLPAVITSGLDLRSVEADLDPRPVLLRKPYRFTELLSALRSLVGDSA